MVRPPQLATILIFNIGRTLQGVMGAALIALGARNFLSRNGHLSGLYSGEWYNANSNRPLLEGSGFASDTEFQ